MANHYQILGVSKNATQDEIKRAYRASARASHPDHHPHPDAARRFVAVQRAYQVLGNPASRRRYDLQLDGVRVAQRQGSTAKPATTPPPQDDRKYGTRHRYTNPPPSRAAQQQRYRDTIQYYRLFTRKGMQLPRKEWWNRFDTVFREWGKFQDDSFGIYAFIGPALFAVYHIIRHGITIIGVFWLVLSFIFLRSSYRAAIRNIAERRMKE